MADQASSSGLAVEALQRIAGTHPDPAAAVTSLEEADRVARAALDSLDTGKEGDADDRRRSRTRKHSEPEQHVATPPAHEAGSRGREGADSGPESVPPNTGEQESRAEERWTREELERGGWITTEKTELVQMPCCGFTYEAGHTIQDSDYTCPLCAPVPSLPAEGEEKARACTCDASSAKPRTARRDCPVHGEDAHLRVTGYLCSECESVSSDEAWQAAWWNERSRRQSDPDWNDDYGKDWGLDDRMVCPRCKYVHSDDENSAVDEVKGTFTRLPGDKDGG